MVTPPDGSSLLTDLRRMCESTKPDETPVLYTLGQLRAMLDTRDAPIASWLDAPTRQGFWWITTPARPSPAPVMVNDLWHDEGTLRFTAYHFGTEDTSREDELPGARWLYAEPPAAPAEVIAHNPDRAQLAALGASRPGAGLVGLAYTIDTVADRPERASGQAPDPVTRDPDPTAPGAPGERVERRG